jgi:hypothetical protein
MAAASGGPGWSSTAPLSARGRARPRVAAWIAETERARYEVGLRRVTSAAGQHITEAEIRSTVDDLARQASHES